MENLETQDTVDVVGLDDAALEQQMSETHDATPEKPDDTPASEEGETKDDVTAPPAEDSKPPVETPPADEQVTVSKSEWEKLQKRIEEKEKFIGRQSSEIGTLRQKAQENLERIKQELSNGSINIAKDPLGAANKVVEYNNAMAEDVRLAKEQYAARSQEQVLQRVPNFTENLPVIAEILKADGYPDEVVRDFLHSPYDDDPILLINLARRAEAVKSERTLRAEIEALKKKPQAVVKGIEAAMKESRNMTAGSGTSSGVKADVSADQIPLMSDADIEEQLRNSK